MLISKKKQFGFSMIEVLVSLIIIAVGLLGLASLQITSMKGTNNAHSLNIASMIAMELSDRMRANLAGVNGGFYENDVNCSTNENPCRGTVFCNAQQISRTDVQDMMCGTRRAGKREGGVVNLLPNAVLTVDHNVDCDPNQYGLDIKVLNTAH